MLIKRVTNIICFSILLLCIIIVFIMQIASLSYNISINKIITLVLITMLSFVICIISIKINNYSSRAYIMILFVISFLIYFLWNIYAQTKPVSDYKVIIDGANKIVGGTFKEESFNKTSYFYIYNYQIGYTIYIAAIIKLLGNSLLYVKILESCYIALTSFMIYKIINKMGQKNSAVIASTLYALYIPNIMGVSIINNQHLSTLLLCLSLFYFIKGTKLSTVVSGLLLCFVQIIRPISIIIIIGVFLVCILRAFKENRYKEWLSKFTLFLMAFIIMTKSIDMLIVQYKIAPAPISSSNAKYFKFVLGLKGDGVYNTPTENARKTQVYFDLKKLDFDYYKYNQACIDEIKKTLKDYPKTYLFLAKKMLYFVAVIDNQYEFALDNSKLNRYINLATDFGQAQYIFLLVCALGTLILKLRRDKTEVDIFDILIIGFVLVHIFIEVQTRYRYELYVFTIILASKFLSEIYNLLASFSNRSVNRTI